MPTTSDRLADELTAQGLLTELRDILERMEAMLKETERVTLVVEQTGQRLIEGLENVPEED